MKRIAKTILKISLYFLGGIVLLLIALILSLRLPGVQQFAANQATDYVSGKTKTRVVIEKFYMGFPSSIVIENLFAEDLKHDTLINLRKLEIDVKMLELLNGKLLIGRVDIEGLTANIIRTLPDSSFNFDFFIKAFASKKEDVKEVTVDTTSSSNFEIAVDKVKLQNIRALYDDAVSGVYAKGNIGSLNLDMKKIDLENMKFEGNGLVLANTTGVFEIRKATPSKPDTGASSLLPALVLNKLEIKSVDFGFHNIPDSSFFDFKVGDLSIEPNEIDLNRQWIDLKNVRLHKSDIRIAMQQKPPVMAERQDTSTSENNWKASVGNIDFETNAFSFQVTNLPVAKAGIDYNHLDAQNITLKANGLYYSPSLIKGKISQISFKERCGLDLRKLKTQFVYDSVHAELADLRLETAETRISNYLFASYPTIASLSEHIENLQVIAKLDSSKVSLKDVLQFAPDLVQQPIIRKNQNQIIAINGKIDGFLKDLIIRNLEIRMAGNTKIALDGKLKGLPDADKMRFDVDLKALTTSRKDLENMLPKDMLPAAIRIPDQITLSGNAKGMLNDIDANMLLKSSDGLARIKASFSQKTSTPKYAVHLGTNNLNAGKILKQTPMLGRITATLDAKGQSFDPDRIAANIAGEIRKVELNGYAYQHINLSATATKGIYQATVSIADSNLNLDLNATASMRKDSSFAKAILDLKTANLQKLKFYNEDLKTSMQLEADVRDFDFEKMDGSLKIRNLTVLKESQKIELEKLDANIKNDTNKHAIQVRSDVLDMDFDGNLSIDKTVAAVQNYLSKRVANNGKDSVREKQEFVCTVNVKPHPLFSEALVPDLKKFTGIQIDSKFNNKSDVLTLNAQSELIQYGENIVQLFDLKVDAKADLIKYEASIQKIQSGNISIPKTVLGGKIVDKIIDLGLTVLHPDSGDRLKISASVNQQNRDETLIRLTGENVTINNEKWNIDEGNAIRILPKGINIQKVGLEQEGQFIKVNSINESANAPIDIQFNKFEIGTISRIIEKDTAIVRGLINGDVHIKKLDPFAFTSDLNIANIVFRETPVGNLQIDADNLIANRYTAKVALTGDSNDVKLDGYYQTDQVDLDLNINQLRMKSIEAFASDFIRKTDGYLTGKLDITGKATEPKIDGNITFKDAGFNLVAINNQLLLKNESIHVDTKGIHFKDFTILDPSSQPMQLNGSVLTSNFMDMNFALDITTKNFKVLGTTEKDNPAYYGTMILNSLIKIRGTQNLPVISANAKLLDGSTFTFVVLEGDLNTSRGEGVVVFEDSISASVKLPKDTIKMKTEFRGIDLNANIEVNKNSVFRVIVDPESGDNLEVSGDATLAFSIDQSGKVSLSGTYTLNDGHYQASFQSVLKREFKIKSGSTITWSGDPMDGQIDLTAIYRTQAAATDLLSSELSGMSQNERSAYRKLLNYEVNLNIIGPLLKPQLSFQLDMPPADQLAFGGMVYAKVNVLNTDPNELNKQVFSLLVLNKFLPTGNSNNTSAAGAVSTVARNSVNQILSDQLNALSGKYVKGAELNFNLQTTEDYAGGTTQQNTALQVGLKKELFNSRLSVQVGSSIDLSGGSSQNTSNSNGQSLSGDVLVEYKLTQDGRYRMKAFRENQYEGIIDGILYKTGLGFSYTRDYNYFRELWKSPGDKDTQYSIQKSTK